MIETVNLRKEFGPKVAVDGLNLSTSRSTPSIFEEPTFRGTHRGGPGVEDGYSTDGE
jgi:hypothetical protein